MDANLLAGPAALAIAAALAVVALWKAHVKADERDAAVIAKLAEAVGAFPAALVNLTAIVKDATDREHERNGKA